MSKIVKIFAKHEAIIRRIIARYRPCKEDIEDLTQETFLKCFAAETKHDIENPKAFILKVAKNVAISDARKKQHSSTNSIEDFGGADVYICLLYTSPSPRDRG